jgi:hypothetical protein
VEGQAAEADNANNHGARKDQMTFTFGKQFPNTKDWVW